MDMEHSKITAFNLAVYQRGDPRSNKLALILPGRLDTKDYPHMRSHVEHFSRRGYLALSFDPPGTWESPGNIKLYTMTNYLRAINELIEHFGNRPTVLMGHSSGGTMAMLAGPQNQHVSRIICVMSMMEPGSPERGRVKEIDGDDGGVLVSYRDDPTNSEIQVEFRLPLVYFEDAKRYDIATSLQTYQKPKLFFLGTQDDVVKPIDVRRAYQTSAYPKQLIELDSGHDYRKNPAMIDEVNRSIMGLFPNTDFAPSCPKCRCALI
jgi:predicted alpha/beta-hydrolase family hydrolase